MSFYLIRDGRFGIKSKKNFKERYHNTSMCYIDCLIPFVEAIEKIINNSTIRPYSILSIIIAMVILILFTSLINKSLLDLHQLPYKLARVSQFQHDKRLARETSNKQLWNEIKDEKAAIIELQKDLMMKNTIPKIITFGPLIFMYTILRSAYPDPIVVLPFKILIIKTTILFGMSAIGFGLWYILTSFSITSILYKIFGVDVIGRRNLEDKSNIMLVDS